MHSSSRTNLPLSLAHLLAYTQCINVLLFVIVRCHLCQPGGVNWRADPNKLPARLDKLGECDELRPYISEYRGRMYVNLLPLFERAIALPVVPQGGHRSKVTTQKRLEDLHVAGWVG